MVIIVKLSTDEVPRIFKNQKDATEYVNSETYKLINEISESQTFLQKLEFSIKETYYSNYQKSIEYFI